MVSLPCELCVTHNEGVLAYMPYLQRLQLGRGDAACVYTLNL